MSLDAGSLHAVLRLLHIGGGLLAFAVAPLALLATKGSRRHILAGRCFTLGMAAAAVPGLLLALHPGVPPGLHLTSMLAAYVVAWDFVWAQFIPVLPSYAQELTLAALGARAILWARRRFADSRAGALLTGI
jgi:hypothetical protein